MAASVLVTGIAGNLGQRLLLQLGDFSVTGVDMSSSPAPIARFQQLDLGVEASCEQLVELLQSSRAEAVIHLAFVIDPLRTGVLDLRRMWQINVAGTARVLEAVAEVNRHGGAVRKFIYVSSVSAYGPDLPAFVDESQPLEAHTLPYAIHKMESDEIVQLRAEELGDCRVYILRAHIFTGATMQNYLVGALRGTPTGKGKLAEVLRRRGSRLPLVLPFGRRYLESKFQFVHVDDVARLLVWLLRHGSSGAGLTILNVAGRGEPVTIRDCLQVARGKCLRLPGKAACRFVLQLAWALRISGVPPEALAYMLGSYLMDTRRLKQLLGKEYEQIIQHTVASALADSFRMPAETAAARAKPSSL